MISQVINFITTTARGIRENLGIAEFRPTLEYTDSMIPFGTIAVHLFINSIFLPIMIYIMPKDAAVKSVLRNKFSRERPLLHRFFLAFAILLLIPFGYIVALILLFVVFPPLMYFSEIFALNVIASQEYTAILCLVLGVLAYYIRCEFRLVYAAAELAIGVCAAYYSSGFKDQLSGIQFAGGLYIIVRAIDNLEKAIKPYDRIHKIWTSIFGKKI